MEIQLKQKLPLLICFIHYLVTITDGYFQENFFYRKFHDNTNFVLTNFLSVL